MTDTDDTIPTLPMTDTKLRVLLPDGIGYVEIRTGGVHSGTGYPVVVAEMVTYAADKPARDGRLYEPQVSGVRNTVYMVGRPAEEQS